MPSPPPGPLGPPSHPVLKDSRVSQIDDAVIDIGCQCGGDVVAVQHSAIVGLGHGHFLSLASLFGSHL